MKRTNRRHRNPEVQEINKKPFFSRVSDKSPKSKKGKQAFFQAKLRISKKDDKEEKEADIAAKSLVNRASMESPEEEDKKIQKQAKPEEEEELQAKLNIQKQKVPEEEEELQTKLNIQKQKEPEEEEPIQAKLNIRKQQQPEEEEKIQAKLFIQEQTEPKKEDERIQKESEDKNELSNPPLSENIENTKGSGIHLTPEIRTQMEAFFKADFSKVIIHTDQAAAYMCRKLNARAFTNGSDIYFNTGQYNPGTSDGKKLLAHELSHVVQQNG